MSCKAKPNLSLSANVSASRADSVVCCLSGRKNVDYTTAKSRTVLSFRLFGYDSSIPLNRPFGHGGLNTRRPRRHCSQIAYSSPAELPLLPFPIDQILVPSEIKTLHLYEARYLALLDESLLRKMNIFVHFILEPVAINDTSAEASFAARYGCLVIIEKVEPLDVGALVSIRGIGRVKIVKFVQADPYLKGLVIPLQDNVPECISKINYKTMELKEALYSLNSLEIKLKAPKEVLLQTQIANSLMWVKKEPTLDCGEAFVPSFAERVSFAALQPVSGSTQSELLTLQKEKLRAMDIRDTLERLDKSIDFVKKNISMVAAKLAIQSLEAQ